MAVLACGTREVCQRRAEEDQIIFPRDLLDRERLELHTFVEKQRERESTSIWVVLNGTDASRLG